MRLLFVCPYTPTQIRTRSYNLLLALAARGNQLTLATVWETEAEREALASLERAGLPIITARLKRTRIARNLVAALAKAQPLQARYCWQPELGSQIAASLAQSPVDVVHIEHLRGAIYGLRLRAEQAGRSRPTPVVWDSVDCISLLFTQAARSSRSLFGRWVSRFELHRTRRYEGHVAARFDKTLAASRNDLTALEQLAREFDQGLPIGGGEVLPNGVDLDYFQPNYGARQTSTIVLSGKMSYHANVTAALHLVHDIMPMVWSEMPEAEVVIAGSTPPAAVRALTAAGRVRVTGFVPDLRPFLQQATIAAAPIAYGAGIQNKVLEAMASATPTVASPQAVSALAVRPGADVLVADDPRSFAQAILRLLQAPALGRQLGAAGREYVTQHHHWPTIASRLEAIYRELIHPPS